MNNFKDRLVRLQDDVQDLWSSAYHDSLTSLPNRAALEDSISSCLKNISADSNSVFSLLFMDLNGFKAINDTRGHEVGDQVLIEVAERLKKMTDISAFREGGDEFVVLTTTCRTPQAAVECAEEICEILSAPHDIEGTAAHVSPSVGIVYCDDRKNYDDDDAIASRDIIRDADQTMYLAKILSKTSLFVPPTTGTRKPVGRSLLFGPDLLARFESKDYKSVLRSGIGRGRIFNSEIAQECDFRLVQYSDGENRLSCRIGIESAVWKSIMLYGKSPHFKFEGTVDTPENGSKCLVSIEELAYFSSAKGLSPQSENAEFIFFCGNIKINFDQKPTVAAKFYIANLRFPEHTFSMERPLRLVVNGLIITIDRFGGKAAHDEKIRELEATGGVDVTCWADIDLSSQGQTELAVETMTVVCTMLSFMQGSLVSWIGYDLVSACNDVQFSLCSPSISGRMAPLDTSGLWTASSLESRIPRLCRNLPANEGKWNLKVILPFLSKAHDDEDFVESEGVKVVNCIEILVNSFEDQFATSRDPASAPSNRPFEKRLLEMCEHLEMGCFADASEPQSNAMARVVGEVAALRESLRSRGTLNLPVEPPEDPELRSRDGFERWRRVHFLRDFIQDCIGTILDPTQTWQLCPLYMD